MTPRHAATPLAAWLGLTLCASASAVSLDALGCAAGVYCRPQGVNPEEARVVLNLGSQAEAERAFVEASRDWPDSLWRCAATGSQCGSLTQDEAQVLIPMGSEAFAAAEVLRGRVESGTQAAPEPTPPAPVGSPRPQAGAPTPRANKGIQVETPQPTRPTPPGRGGIEVEVARPGPAEIILPGGPQEIQPLDGPWRFVNGQPRTAGKCLPGIGAALAGQMPAPMSGSARFERPFQASQILRNPNVSWQRLAPNHWRGTLSSTRGKAMQAHWDVRVLSPTRMQGDSVVQVRVPSACTISTPFTFERQ
ncbi:MAG: hypothetical protein LCH89_05075 [Proteobacteria bacterium]|jgi:hypothetical protein|nr:hypothetical protein [Pseudomonadota bacterium]